MTAPVKLWHYHLPSVNGEGWAEIVLGSNGFFAAVSDWGNYAFIWRDPGVDDFRKFFLRAPESWDYFAGKLGQEIGKQYDGPSTLRLVKQEIIARRREGDWAAEEAREEWDLLGEFEGLDNPDARSRWAEHTSLPAWEFGCRNWDPQIKMFCTVTLGRLADLIRAELAAEAG